jgi:centromeric protein E
VLKFSAMEIYNEAVRDLLSTSSSPLRLLDDPEVNINIVPYLIISIFRTYNDISLVTTLFSIQQRGTVVEGLIEDTLVDWNHLLELISICEGKGEHRCYSTVSCCYICVGCVFSIRDLS